MPTPDKKVHAEIQDVGDEVRFILDDNPAYSELVQRVKDLHILLSKHIKKIEDENKKIKDQNEELKRQDKLSKQNTSKISVFAAAIILGSILVMLLVAAAVLFFPPSWPFATTSFITALGTGSIAGVVYGIGTTGAALWSGIVVKAAKHALETIKAAYSYAKHGVMDTWIRWLGRTNNRKEPRQTDAQPRESDAVKNLAREVHEQYIYSNTILSKINELSSAFSCTTTGEKESYTDLLDLESTALEIQDKLHKASQILAQMQKVPPNNIHIPQSSTPGPSNNYDAKGLSLVDKSGIFFKSRTPATPKNTGHQMIVTKIKIPSNISLSEKDVGSSESMPTPPLIK